MSYKGISRALLLDTMLVLWAVPIANADSIHKSPHLEDTKQLIGVKGIQVTEFEGGERANGGGLSVFYERNLIEGWLELELSSGVVWIEGTRIIALDVLLKKPFHVNEHVNPYIGIGPGVAIFHHEETETRFAIVTVAGSYLWFAEHWGIDLETAYGLILTKGITHELSFQLGPVVRF